MAGDWIAMQKDLWGCPEVVRILSAMCPQNVRSASASCPHGVLTPSERVRKKSEIIGSLFRTWCIFDTFSEDGTLFGYTSETLDEEVGIEGWAENLQHVGWLHIAEDSLEMPGFSRHLGQSAKRRIKDAQRKREARKNPSAKRPQNVRKASAKCPQESGLQNRTEENSNKPPTPKGANRFDASLVKLPSVLNTAEFSENWKEWVEHRRQIGHRLTETTTEKQLNKLAKAGAAAAIEMICHSIEGGYQGLFPPNGKTASAAPAPAVQRAPTLEEVAEQTRIRRAAMGKGVSQ